jgi:hypothetical protein
MPPFEVNGNGHTPLARLYWRLNKSSAHLLAGNLLWPNEILQLEISALRALKHARLLASGFLNQGSSSAKWKILIAETVLYLFMHRSTTLNPLLDANVG